MQNMFFHINDDLEVSSIVTHNDFGPTHTVRTEVIYPVETALAMQDESKGNFAAKYKVVCPQEFEFIWWQDTLFQSERAGNVLVVEPDSANWMVLNKKYYTVFENMKKPVPFGYVLYNPYVPKGETYNFVLHCISENFLRVENSLTIFEPLDVTLLPYIDNFVLEISRGSQRISEKLASGAISLVFEKTRDDTVWIELLSDDPEGDKNIISHIIRMIDEERNKKFQKVKVLLHSSCESVNGAIAAFLNWNGILVRGYCDSVDSLMKESTVTGVRNLEEQEILESLSLNIESPDDFFALEAFLFNNKIRDIRLAFSPVEKRKRLFKDHIANLMAELIIKMLEKILYTNGWEKYPRIYPVSTIISNLVTTYRSVPCSMNRYGGKSIFIDKQGNIYYCGMNAGDIPVGKVNSSRAKLLTIIDSAPLCAIRKPECRLCQWRNFCPGICPGIPWNDRKEGTGEIYCLFFQNIIPELMWKIEENREFLKFRD